MNNTLVLFCQLMEKYGIMNPAENHTPLYDMIFPTGQEPRVARYYEFTSFLLDTLKMTPAEIVAFLDLREWNYRWLRPFVFTEELLRGGHWRPHDFLTVAMMYEKLRQRDVSAT